MIFPRVGVCVEELGPRDGRSVGRATCLRLLLRELHAAEKFCHGPFIDGRLYKRNARLHLGKLRIGKINWLMSLLTINLASFLLVLVVLIISFCCISSKLSSAIDPEICVEWRTLSAQLLVPERAAIAFHIPKRSDLVTLGNVGWVILQ